MAKISSGRFVIYLVLTVLLGCGPSSGPKTLEVINREGSTISLLKKYPGKKIVVAFHRGHW